MLRNISYKAFLIVLAVRDGLYAIREPRKGVVLVAIGDSHTHFKSTRIRRDQFYPSVVAHTLRLHGVAIQSRNYGISGNTTRQMRDRYASVLEKGVPAILVLHGGANDTHNGISQEETVANLVEIGTAFLEAGTIQLVVSNTHFMNFSENGDALDMRSPTMLYGIADVAQKQAYRVLASRYSGRIAFCDTFAYTRNLIVAGKEHLGSASWHIADKNVHLNALGQRYVAEAVVDTITFQDGWMDQLTRVSTA